MGLHGKITKPQNKIQNYSLKLYYIFVYSAYEDILNC